MKTQETISLNLAATLLAGVLSSMMILTCISKPPLLVVAMPTLIACVAAFFQYSCVMKPWHKAIGELLAKSLNLQESASAAPGSPVQEVFDTIGGAPAKTSASRESGVGAGTSGISSVSPGAKTGSSAASTIGSQAGAHKVGENSVAKVGPNASASSGSTASSASAASSKVAAAPALGAESSSTIGAGSGKKKTTTQTTKIISSNSGSNELGMLRESIEIATERFKENRLRENALIQHAVDVICVIDLSCKVLSVNPASNSVWGYRPEEMIGKQITDFLVSDDVKNTMKALVGAEKSIDKIYFENRFRKKSGEIVDLLWSAHLSATDRGLFCIAHDITERKRAELLLRESEQRVRGILESLPAGVVVVNRAGKVEFMNKTAMELCVYSETERKGLMAANLFSFYKEEAVAKVFESAGYVDPGFDCSVLRSTGERFPAEASMRSMSWGSARACLIIFLDVTSKHEIEQAKREFVAMVSHDLRTPLTAISLIFAYLLDGLAGELSEDGIDFAKRGQNSCERLMTLVQDLLDLEKMKAGKFVMDKIETSIKDVVSAALETVKPYADAQGISLDHRCSADLSGFCDGGRIIQVLVNLLSNAIKFSVADGTVTIDVNDGEKYITLNVSNRGRTISPEKLKSIFEKFEQADERGVIERKGTGLGLTISKTIIEQHGCKIWVESSDETGTTFSFTIPKFDDELDAVDPT